MARYRTLKSVWDELDAKKPSDILGYGKCLFCETEDPDGANEDVDVGEVSIRDCNPYENARYGFYLIKVILLNEDGQGVMTEFPARNRDPQERGGKREGLSNGVSQAMSDAMAAGKIWKEQALETQRANLAIVANLARITEVTTGLAAKLAEQAEGTAVGGNIDPRMIFGAVAMYQDYQKNGKVTDEVMENLNKLFQTPPPPERK